MKEPMKSILAGIGLILTMVAAGFAIISFIAPRPVSNIMLQLYDSATSEPVVITVERISVITNTPDPMSGAEVAQVEVTRIVIITATEPETTDTPTITSTPSQTPTPTETPTATATPIVVPLSDMRILAGEETMIRKPDTVIRGVAYPDALYFDNRDGSIKVELLGNYDWLELEVGVDDTAGLRGYKTIQVFDQDGVLLFSRLAEPVEEPISARIDVSGRDWIHLTSWDPNGQTYEFIRWTKLEFISKP